MVTVQTARSLLHVLRASVSASVCPYVTCYFHYAVVLWQQQLSSPTTPVSVSKCVMLI